MQRPLWPALLLMFSLLSFAPGFAQDTPEPFPEGYLQKLGVQRVVQHCTVLPPASESKSRSFTVTKNVTSHEYLYSRQGQLFRESLYSPSETFWKKSYSYDSKGRLSSIQDSSWFMNGGGIWVKTWNSAYDLQGRKILEYCLFDTNPSHKIEYQYNGNTLTKEIESQWAFDYLPRERRDFRSRDSLLITTVYQRNSKEQSWDTYLIIIETHDAQDRLIKRTKMTPTGEIMAEYYFTYNPDGRLTEKKYFDKTTDGHFTDAEGNTQWHISRYEYDEKGILTTQTSLYNDFVNTRMVFEYEYRHYR